MKKRIPSWLQFLLASLLFSACTATPEKYFDMAVLNSNRIVGFASEGQARDLESPSVKMGKDKNDILVMERKEVITDKIQFVEEALGNLRDMKQTDDNKEIMQASIALYEFILPVYKNEYMELARSYDEADPKEQIEKQTQSIHDKYFEQFELLYHKLIGHGQVYAQKHKIEVHWNM